MLHVVVVVLSPVHKSTLLHVILTPFTKSVHHVQMIVHVTIIDHVAPFDSPVITKLLGLLVVNHVG